MQSSVKLTADGSHTLYVPELDEHYHSINGAFTESMHIFIREGLEEAVKLKSKLSVFEVGFGTGLNALLTLAKCSNSKINVDYHTLELYPLEIQTINEINYCKSIPVYEPFKDEYIQMHTCDWGKSIKISENFTLTKWMGNIIDFELPIKFDLIFFDAFAPDKQPEVWSNTIISKLVDSLNPGGIFVTYSVKGDVRRALQSAGMMVERIPGPPGKRQMLRAVKK
jgi:tRNA U34 5-methylaminomethyl-2-thiouridine-forming methyltransferase MnmC